MVKRIGWIVVVAAVLFSCLWLAGRAPAEEKAMDTDQMLEQILKNQEKMIQDLQLIKRELDRIRVRVL